MKKNGKNYNTLMKAGKKYTLAFKNGLITMDGRIDQVEPSGVRYIRDWVNGSTSPIYPPETKGDWVEIEALIGRNNMALGKSVTTSGTVLNGSLEKVTNGIINNLDFVSIGDNLINIQVDLGQIYDIEIIKIWHYYDDGRTYNNTKTEVSVDGVTWVKIFDSAISGTYQETSLGHVMYV